MKIFFLLFALSAAWMAAGCASSPKAAHIDPEKIDWSGRIGTYTYDEAIAELGKPAVTGDSNSGRTAEWVLRRSPRVSFGLGVGAGSYGSHSGMGMGVGSTTSPPEHGANLRLTFDPEGKLKEWAKIQY